MNEKMKTLKRENVIKVFNASLERNNTSRTVIAEDSHLSFVTVDKIVDALLDADILKQTNSSKSAVVLRKSRILLAKPHYWIAVYVLSDSEYSFHICDLSLRIIKSFSFVPEDTVFIDDNLSSFLKKTLSFAKAYVVPEYCCAAGILVPGEYDEPRDRVFNSSVSHLSAISIKSFFSPFSFGKLPYVVSVYSAFAKEIAKVGADKSTYCLFLNDGKVLGAYVTGVGSSIHIKDLGNIKSPSGRTLEALVKAVPHPDSLFVPLSEILFTLLHTVHITDITVCGNLYSSSGAVCSMLKKELSRYCERYSILSPEITAPDLLENSVRFISREIRDRWFSEEILGFDTDNDK